jgi:hypothetical protein
MWAEDTCHDVPIHYGSGLHEGVLDQVRIGALSNPSRKLYLGVGSPTLAGTARGADADVLYHVLVG